MEYQLNNEIKFYLEEMRKASESKPKDQKLFNFAKDSLLDIVKRDLIFFTKDYIYQLDFQLYYSGGKLFHYKKNDGKYITELDCIDPKSSQITISNQEINERVIERYNGGENFSKISLDDIRKEIEDLIKSSMTAFIDMKLSKYIKDGE